MSQPNIQPSVIQSVLLLKAAANWEEFKERKIKMLVREGWKETHMFSSAQVALLMLSQQDNINDYQSLDEMNRDSLQ